MENMHEMVLESQRLADSLESSIKAREAVLEDLSDLVDEKILRYEKLSGEKFTGIPKEKKEVKTEQIHLETVLKKQETPKEQVVQQDNKKDLKTKILSLNAAGKSSIDIASSELIRALPKSQNIKTPSSEYTLSIALKTSIESVPISL